MYSQGNQEKSERSQIINNKNERVVITTDPMDIKRIKNEFYNAPKFGNLKKPVPYKMKTDQYSQKEK